jgi:hypothetical protein
MYTWSICNGYAAVSVYSKLKEVENWDGFFLFYCDWLLVVQKELRCYSLTQFVQKYVQK